MRNSACWARRRWISSRRTRNDWFSRSGRFEIIDESGSSADVRLSGRVVGPSGTSVTFRVGGRDVVVEQRNEGKLVKLRISKRTWADDVADAVAPLGAVGE